MKGKLTLIAAALVFMTALSAAVSIQPSNDVDIETGESQEVTASSSSSLSSLFIERWSEEKNEWIADDITFSCSNGCEISHNYFRTTEGGITVRAVGVKEDGSETNKPEININWAEETAAEADLRVHVEDSGGSGFGDSLRDAEVYLRNSRDYGPEETDSSGNAYFSGIEPDTYDIKVECGDKTRWKDDVNVEEGENEVEVSFSSNLESDCDREGSEDDTDDETDDELEAGFDYRPSSPEAGESVNFDASDSSGDIEEYRWDFDDGTTETDDDPETSHSFDEEGSYDVELRVEDGDGDTNSTTRTVEVREEPTQCRIDVGRLDLEPNAIASGESATASITLENNGDKDQEIDVKIYTGEATFYQDNFEIDGGDSRTVETDVSVDEDSLVFARVKTTGKPCGDRSFTRSDELIFLGEDIGEAELNVKVEDEDGDDIESAKVTVRNQDTRFDFTESDGETGFSLRPGDYEVTVSKDDYETTTQTITLGDGDSRQLDFTLVRTEDDTDDDDETDEEDAELTVHVEDDENDELEDARVTVANGDTEVEYTDSGGDAEFSLEADEYDIVAECNGETETDDVDLDEAEEETVDIEFDEEFEDDECETDTDDDTDDGDGLEIRNVDYPARVCRGSSFVADVTIENNGGFHEVVTVTGSGLGSINIGESFTLREGEDTTSGLRFTNVEGSGDEEFKITVTNHDSDSATRTIDVEDCGVTGTPGRASGVSMELNPRETVVGDTVMVKGYVDGVRGRTEVRVDINGRREARISTQPDGYYQAFVRPEHPGEQTVTVRTNGAIASRELNVIPTSTVLSVTGPEKVFEGQEFEVCSDVESQVDSKIYLMKGDELLETKNARGEVCFDRTASGTGEHRFTVRSLTHGRESSASTEISILEAGNEVENFPDQIAAVESEEGMVKVDLYNTNDEMKTYSLELLGVPADWMDRSQKEVVLAKGERKTVYFYITPQSEGEFNPLLWVESDGETIYSQEISMKIGGTKKPVDRDLFDRLREVLRF